MLATLPPGRLGAVVEIGVSLGPVDTASRTLADAIN